MEAVTLTAHVSKGTYIRSLARDIAHALGTVGHVTYLRRIKAGPFDLAHAISLDKLGEAAKGRTLEQHLLPLRAGLDDIPALVLTEAEAARLRNGQSVMPSEAGASAGLGRLKECAMIGAWHDQALIALARVENGRIRPVRVINR